MLEAILFDVDGVLVDSEKLYCASIQRTFREYRVELSQEEYIKWWMIEINPEGALKYYNIKDSLEGFRAKRAKHLDGLFNNLQMMPYAREIVDYLGQDFPLAVVSSAPRSEVLMKLNKFNLADKFKVMVTASEVTRRKPHPEPYQKAVQLLHIAPENALVIEDNPSGITSAKAAGCKAIAYPNGFTEKMDFSEADMVIFSLQDIDSELLRLF